MRYPPIRHLCPTVRARRFGRKRVGVANPMSALPIQIRSSLEPFGSVNVLHRSLATSVWTGSRPSPKRYQTTPDPASLLFNAHPSPSFCCSLGSYRGLSSSQNPLLMPILSMTTTPSSQQTREVERGATMDGGQFADGGPFTPPLSPPLPQPGVTIGSTDRLRPMQP